MSSIPHFLGERPTGAVQSNLNRSLGHPEQLGDPGVRHVSAIAKREQALIERLELAERRVHGQAL
jgi:hypothetical protein